MILSPEPPADLFQYGFSNGHLPDCAVPIVSWLGEDGTLGTHGTGTLVQRVGKFYLLTARHCLVQVEGPIATAASRLLIPHKVRDNHVVGPRDWLKFDRAFWPRLDRVGHPGSEDIDLAILSIDVSDKKVERSLRSRAIKLPTTGSYLPSLYKAIGTTVSEVPLLALGFPAQGNTYVDYERNAVRQQRAWLTGSLVGPGPFQHSLSMRLRDNSPVTDINGMSGGPVIIHLQQGTRSNYLFAGMTCWGGPSTLNFVALDWIVWAINEFEGVENSKPHVY